MASIMMERQDFFNAMGVQNSENAYTPISIGRNQHVGNVKDTLSARLCKVDFTTTQELADYHLENVHAEGMYYVKNGQPVEIKDRMLIVGDDSERQYAVHSNKYVIVQNNVIKDALVLASRRANLDLMGDVITYGGKTHIFGFIKNPEYHVGGKDPMGLGIDCYNSFDGSRKFGLRGMGVRFRCSNGMIFGDVIGSEEEKHFSTVEELADNFGLFIESYIGQADFLQGVFDNLRQRMLTVEEQDALLLGIGFGRREADLMTGFRDQLNPELAGKKDVSVYDIFNVATAYISHRTSGGNSMSASMYLMEKAEDILTAKSLPKVIDKGFEIRKKIIESGVQSAPLEVFSEA